MAPPQRVGRDRLIGQHVHIRRGMYKGMRGICKDTTAASARVELQAKNKVVNVDKNDLSVVEYVYTNSQKLLRTNYLQSSFWQDHRIPGLQCIERAIVPDAYRTRCPWIAGADISRRPDTVQPWGRLSDSSMGFLCQNSRLDWSGRYGRFGSHSCLESFFRFADLLWWCWWNDLVWRRR